jgi:hypothetical protein
MRTPLAAAVVCVAITFMGCASKPLQTRDLSPQEAPWMNGRRTVADGTKLKMIFESDSQTLRIKRIDYKVADGNLYLWPIRASEPFQPAEFTLDTKNLELSQPWQEHVYWVGTVNWDGPLGRLIDPDPLGDRVERARATVSDK